MGNVHDDSRWTQAQNDCFHNTHVFLIDSEIGEKTYKHTGEESRIYIKVSLMEIKPDAEVLEEITAEYNKDPEGNWKVTAFQGEKGRYDLYVIKGKRFWQIKTEFITPYRYIGVGGKTTAKASEEEHTFGLRPLPREYVKRIVRYARKGKVPEKVFKEIMKIPPVAATDATGESKILEGPVLLSPLEEISPSQRELDKKLSLELDKLVFKEEGWSSYR